MQTVEELVKAAGITQYDYAVPQPWLDAGMKATGLNVGTVVWCYDPIPGQPLNHWGYPVALDAEGQAFLTSIERHAEKDNKIANLETELEHKRARVTSLRGQIDDLSRELDEATICRQCEAVARP